MKIFLLIVILVISIKNKIEACSLIQDMSSYSGIYEGNLDFYFGDGGGNEVGRLYIDWTNKIPVIYYDGVFIEKFEIDKNIIKANYITYFEIRLSDDLNGSSILFNDEFYTNEGKDFTYPLKKIGNLNDVQNEINKFTNEDRMFSEYWELFCKNVKSKNFSVLTKNLNYPVIDSCTSEFFGNEEEVEKKLANIFTNINWDEYDNNPLRHRLTRYHEKKFGGKWFIQKNGSIFFNIVNGEIRIVNFNCAFG